MKRRSDGLRVDPIEKDPAFRSQLDEATRMAKEEAAAHEGQLGYCHALWGAKKKILRDRFGLRWRSPAEMNPDVIFD